MIGVPKWLFLSFLLSLVGASAHADWESNLLPDNFDIADSLEKAAVIARKKGKSVIVYYTRTSCPPCDLLRGKLRSDSELLAAFREGYVFTAVWGNSMDRNEREKYRTNYGVKGAPTWILFNSDMEYRCTSSGGIYPNEDWRNVHEGMQASLKNHELSSISQVTGCRRG